ncbi:sigma-70 family RNA polymerase sigma factor [Kitasatospora fiedleri]|uniref:sigma-70 family RNA polymerase sigma factor n=1 Tax=Kitasatospora fiedleri TaxID=2991545 RepID=UPI00249B0F71|nr:sigma-70 family RNA polymerase sigma factor [Kitasatospora fiedleri]
MQQTEITDDMIQTAQAGDSGAMWLIIDAHDSLLRGIVNTVVGTARNVEEREDLMQEARCALISAVLAYDTASAAKLASWAYRLVHRSVLVAWLGMTTTVTVEPDLLITARRAITRAGGDMERAYASINAQRAGDGTRRIGGTVSRQRWDAVVAELTTPVVQWDAPAGGSGTSDGTALTLADTVPDTSADRSAERAEARALAEQALGSILPRRALVLRATYGIGMPEMTSSEIAGHLGHVTVNRVRTIRAEGLAQARTALGLDLAEAA